MIGAISVLYDADCGFCRRCRDFMLRQARFMDVEFVPRGSIESRARFPGLEDANDDELLVVDDAGGIYRGPPAFLICLYALVEYRAWSFKLASPTLMPLARQGFELVSSRRHRINEWLGLATDDQVRAQLEHAIGRRAPICVGRRS